MWYDHLHIFHGFRNYCMFWLVVVRYGMVINAYSCGSEPLDGWAGGCYMWYDHSHIFHGLRNYLNGSVSGC